MCYGPIHNSRSTEIIARLEADFSWKPATIKTLLNRLKTKEFIAMEKIEGKFYYDARILEADHLESTWQALFDNICNTKHGDLLISMMREVSSVKGTWSGSAKYIDKKRASAPLEIKCHCPQGQCRCGHGKETH